MGNQGTTTINFGAFPGSNEASVVVTGQAGIVSGSLAEAFVMDEASSDFAAVDHAYLNLLATFTCGSIVAATGFTINARSLEQLQGTWNIKWVWN